MSQLQPFSNFSTPKWRTLSFDTPRWLYSLHRALFRVTNGYWNDGVSAVLKMINGQYRDIESADSVFKFTESDIQKTVESIKKNGYCVLDQKIPEELIAQIYEFNAQTKVRGLIPTDDYKKDGFRWSEPQLPEHFKNISARCDYDNSDIINSPTLQKVTFDPLFLSIANRYLGIRPILSSVSMWWSFSVSNKKQFADVSAQAFHFDMDRLKWLNFFIYLNDVGPENGPHCYVRGSHKRLPRQFLKRGRFTDENVRKHYGDNVLELGGRRGTILAVDTRGLHKGKLLESGERLMLQLIFCNSLFGQKYDKVSAKVEDSKLKHTIAKYWHTYFNVI